LVQRKTAAVSEPYAKELGQNSWELKKLLEVMQIPASAVKVRNSEKSVSDGNSISIQRS
jgi:hypothetical protein